MNLLLVTMLAVASMSVFPAGIRGTSTPDAQQPGELEPPHALPLTAAAVAAPADAAAAAKAPTSALGEIWQEDDREVLIRNERGTKNNNGGGAGGSGKKERAKKTRNGAGMVSPSPKPATIASTLDTKIPPTCRYIKSPWTDCDQKTNTRSRTLNLKKGEDGCVQTRTIQKKCKKACRYVKGTWSECTTGQMVRSDTLKAVSDPSCEATRQVSKNCNQGKSKGDKKDRPAKNNKQDKGSRKGSRA